MGLIPMHISPWLDYFPCNQYLIIRSEGRWGEVAMRAVAKFLDVSVDSALEAAEATAIRPEQFSYNQEATLLSIAAGAGGAGAKPLPMLNSTKVALQAFFEAHWEARFQPDKGQVETCL